MIIENGSSRAPPATSTASSAATRAGHQEPSSAAPASAKISFRLVGDQEPRRRLGARLERHVGPAAQSPRELPRYVRIVRSQGLARPSRWPYAYARRWAKVPSRALAPGKWPNTPVGPSASGGLRIPGPGPTLPRPRSVLDSRAGSASASTKRPGASPQREIRPHVLPQGNYRSLGPLLGPRWRRGGCESVGPACPEGAATPAMRPREAGAAAAPVRPSSPEGLWGGRDSSRAGRRGGIELAASTGALSFLLVEKVAARPDGWGSRAVTGASDVSRRR